ncbi:MAG: MFS transporter, partial [Beijerinckiaceae bacterium]
GALTGAGLVAALGMGPAYAAVTALYVVSCALTLQTGGRPPEDAPAAAQPAAPVQPQSPLRDLKEGFVYVWTTPYLLGTMMLAFFLNMTAFPLFNGLQAYVVKAVYNADQATLGAITACAATGALAGSIFMTRYGSVLRPSRAGIYSAMVWFVVLFVYSRIETPQWGMAVIFFAGVCQATGMISIATVLLRNSDQKFRGRIMGVRMLAIYGNMPGILLAGFLIPRFGYQNVALAYCLFGAATTLAIVWRWRDVLWRADAPANAL